MTNPPRQLRLAVASVLLCGAQPCLAFGDVGFLTPCPSFTGCTAALASSGSWLVREEVSNIGAGFLMPTDLAAGVTVFQDIGSVATTAAPLVRGRGIGLPVPIATPEFFRSATAKAQTDFAVNRVETSMSRGVSGALTRGNGSAEVRLNTFAQATSAWRDVWQFNGDGRFSAVVAIDGSSGLGAVGPFDASYQFSPTSTYADWFYDLRVWDVTNQTVSDDFELGGPTPVGRARITGNDERRSSLDGSAALAFDFAAGVSYVVTAQLNATSYDGREIDLYNTARLQDVVLSGGAQLNALSGHDYLAPVPEPAPAALLLAGLAGLVWLSRRGTTACRRAPA